jgi:BON domain
MDPIKTAVKYALIPLRIVVQLGEAFVGETSPPEPTPPSQPRPRRQQAKPRQQRRAPDPQASSQPKDLDDVGLARKVESVIFRDPEVPKGQIDVNAADGVVWLRGEAKTPEMIKRLEAEARDIPEVREVENLLHLPKTPAPTRTDTPPSQRKTRRTSPSPESRRVETAVTNEGSNGSAN